MEASPGGGGRSLQALLQGSAREHAALAALVAGSSLRGRVECAPLPPLSFADAQRLAEGRDGRQRGREGKTKLPVKGILAGPPDTSAFWHFAEVAPPSRAHSPPRHPPLRAPARVPHVTPDPGPAGALPPLVSGSTGGGTGLLPGRGARGPGGANRRARRPARRPDLRGAAGRAAARRRARGGAGAGGRWQCSRSGQLAAPAGARARRGAARAGGRRHGASIRLGLQSPNMQE